MKNHFQTNRSQVKTKICDEDLPTISHPHIGVHKFSHQCEQVWKTLLNLSSLLKVICHGPHLLSQFWLKTCRKTTVQPDAQFHMDSKHSITE